MNDTSSGRVCGSAKASRVFGHKKTKQNPFNREKCGRNLRKSHRRGTGHTAGSKDVHNKAPESYCIIIVNDEIGTVVVMLELCKNDKGLGGIPLPGQTDVQ